MRVEYVERVAGRLHTHTRERSELGLPLPPFLTTVEQHVAITHSTAEGLGSLFQLCVALQTTFTLTGSSPRLLSTCTTRGDPLTTVVVQT